MTTKRELSSEELRELQVAFRDLLNYDAENPVAPINPLIYRAPDGDTCLHIAAFKNDLRSVRLLIDGGAEIDAVGDLGNSPLHVAVSHGYLEVAKFLVSHGASLDLANEDGETPRQLAIDAGIQGL